LAAVEFIGRSTADLSGGEAQRLCLARALAVEPEVLLLDEPTSALDGLTASLIADLARDHVAGGGTVVLVSHDLAVVCRVSHHVLVLHGGRLIAAGPPQEIDYLEADVPIAVISAWLGHASKAFTTATYVHSQPEALKHSGAEFRASCDKP
jgi:ABC-type glutathione transport system ATPase component